MPTQQENQYHSTDDISLKELILKIKDWVNYLLIKWKIIFLAVIIGALIGFGYAYFQKVNYKAVLTFVLEEEKSTNNGIGGALGLASQFGFDVGGGNTGGIFTGNNLMELMKSRSIVEKALLNPLVVNGKTTSYAQYYLDTKKAADWQKKPELKYIKFLPNASRSNYTRQQDSILEKIYLDIIADNLTVSQKDKKVSILVIEMKDDDEVFAKEFTENIAQEVSDFYVETKSKKAKISVAILQKQTDSIRAELNAAMTGVAIANDNTYNLNPALNINRVPSAKRQIDVQANTALLTQLIANLEVAKANLRKDTPLIQVIDRPIYPLTKTKLSKLKYLIMGGLIAGILTIGLLITRKLFTDIMW